MLCIIEAQYFQNFFHQEDYSIFAYWIRCRCLLRVSKSASVDVHFTLNTTKHNKFTYADDNAYFFVAYCIYCTNPSREYFLTFFRILSTISREFEILLCSN